MTLFYLGTLLGCEEFDAFFLAMFVAGLLFGVAGASVYFARNR